MTSIVEALEQYGRTTYLLTVGDDGPHTSNTEVVLAHGGLTCPLSKSAARNVRTRPAISLFWPPREPGGYGIIMNGTVQVSAPDAPAPMASITLSKAVFHRPGAPGPGQQGPCTSDCRPIELAASTVDGGQ